MARSALRTQSGWMTPFASMSRRGLGLALLLVAGNGRAQADHHDAVPDTSALDSTSKMHFHDMAGMDMSDMHASHTAMHGMCGPYSMTREASGTAWQPDAAEHSGIHVMRGEWT